MVHYSKTSHNLLYNSGHKLHWWLKNNYTELNQVR